MSQRTLKGSGFAPRGLDGGYELRMSAPVERCAVCKQPIPPGGYCRDADKHLRGRSVAPTEPVKKKPGTLMPEDEWRRTAAVRRELIERLGHVAWSQMTPEQCDEMVRQEAAKRSP